MKTFTYTVLTLIPTRRAVGGAQPERADGINRPSVYEMGREEELRVGLPVGLRVYGKPVPRASGAYFTLGGVVAKVKKSKETATVFPGDCVKVTRSKPVGIKGEEMRVTAIVATPKNHATIDLFTRGGPHIRVREEEWRRGRTGFGRRKYDRLCDWALVQRRQQGC